MGCPNLFPLSRESYVHIRSYIEKDAQILPQIFHQAVHRIGALDYSIDQIAAWSPGPVSADVFHDRVNDGRQVFVAVSETDEPIAFLELESDGHIDCFYCHPDAAGAGVGHTLYLAAEEAARAQGITLLFVEASEAARRFFIKAGFEEIARRDFMIRSVPIHNYAMQKRLS
jgi:putative acetyltransferase